LDPPAEGYPRRAFTVEDVRRMEDDRIELVEGEFVVMAAKGYAHEIIKNALIKTLDLAAAPEFQNRRRDVDPIRPGPPS
jgi:hypothetical protein